jgi:hypothetical protein
MDEENTELSLLVGEIKVSLKNASELIIEQQ